MPAGGLGTAALISGGAQLAGGLFQSIFSGRRSAEKDLEKYANSYKPNAGILDYYNKALAKYNPNAYQSADYQQQNNQIQRNIASGINAAQNRRSGLAAIAGVTQQANDASAKAVGQAERMQNANLAQLGNATKMKAGEESKKFDMLYNLKAMKAGQAASRENAGYKNIFGGLSTVAAGFGGGKKGGTAGGLGDGWDGLQ